MYGQACSNDQVTLATWKDVWLKNIRSNFSRVGSFVKNGCQEIVEKYRHKPVIIAGSGSSLKRNAIHLRDRGDIPLISCLHNFAFFEDIGVKPDYYVTLDAGEIVIPELAEGGKGGKDYYEATKEHTLLAYVGSPPKLFDRWKGRVLWYNAPVPSPEVMALTSGPTPELETFSSYVASGGNALGACMYFARAIGGCNPVIFVGADFSFGWERKFHAWNSPYDKQAQGGFYWPDIFGIKVFTWQSYFNFKTWFETIATWRLPGLYINASEGGILGSYPDGNIIQIQQMGLSEVLRMYETYRKIPEGQTMNVLDAFKTPEKDIPIILY